MRTFLRDFFDRFANAAVFANADNLREALDLQQERRAAEVDMMQLQAVRKVTLKLMPRPQRPPRQEAAAHRRERSQLLAAN